MTNKEGEMSNIVTTRATKIPEHLKQLFGDNRAKSAPQARLVFALDATASRQPTWDLASSLTDKMFGAIADGRLNIQLNYFRGHSEFVSSRWISSGPALSNLKRSVTCLAGLTQIEKVIAHIEKENVISKIAAAVFVGDACEEIPEHLYRAAKRLDHVPLFLFQENADEQLARVFKTIADITGGAYSRFDAGSAQRLADLLRAVAAFAVGGRDALIAQNSDAARLLLTQVRK
jgi:hypothetical protein